ncbi:MAG: methyltransferase domain-containing protein [Nitrososphaeria archaeon]|jgi:ubiquinone/menaquinone biosynthesis C-methylase UbiE
MESDRAATHLALDTRDKLEAEFGRDYFIPDKGRHGIYTDTPKNIKLVEYIKSLTPESVVDIGCAYGFLVKRLNSEGIKAVGVDVSKFAYMMRVTDDIQVASVLDLSCFKDKQFDLAVTVELLEHILERDTDRALSEIARVSKRGVHFIDYKEVVNISRRKDVTYVNIKPYEWWVTKVRDVCGLEHIVVHKEIDWYPNPVTIPVTGQKVGLNVGSFLNMLLNTSTTRWINLDILPLEQYARNFGYNFMRVDARILPFPNQNIDYLVASHFLEHLDKNEAQNFLKECHRVLKKDAVMRIAVPDAKLLMELYFKKKLSYFDDILWGGEATEIDKLNALLLSDHKYMYDEDSLSILLERSGFKAIPAGFNRSTRMDLMSQMFDYYPDQSLYMDAIPLYD